jgi:hypothetical protein
VGVPTPQPPSPRPTLSFRGDWEASEPILGQWNGAQCENPPGTAQDDATWNRGTLHVVSDVVAKGKQAARVDLPADAERRQACEALHGRQLGTGHGFPPFEEWYAVSIRLPTNFASNAWGLSLVQFNYRAIWGGPLAVVAHSPTDNTKEPIHVRLTGQAGECLAPFEGGTGCEWSSGIGSNDGGTHHGPWRLIPNSRLTLGSWHDILVHVVWTTDPAKGLIEAFHRERGGEWAQTVPPFTGKPTVQWRPGTSERPSHGTVDKVGAYRAANATAQSVWHDNFCRGSTREIVEACL